MAKATFGAGCFWGVEAAFRQLKGVTATAVGYAGGATENPDVSRGLHRQNRPTRKSSKWNTTRRRFPTKTLLDTFWDNHDPTQLNRQGPDVGSQYRSVIFYHTPEQRQAALDSKQQRNESGKHRRAIVTQIEPAQTFYRAEDYHQQYLEKRGLASCHI